MPKLASDSVSTAIRSLDGLKLEGPQYFDQLKITKKIVDIMIKFKVEHPLRALRVVKLKIASGRARDITIDNLRKWGR